MVCEGRGVLFVAALVLRVNLLTVYSCKVWVLISAWVQSFHFRISDIFFPFPFLPFSLPFSSFTPSPPSLNLVRGYGKLCKLLGCDVAWSTGHKRIVGILWELVSKTNLCHTACFFLILVFVITVSVSWQWKLQVAVDYYGKKLKKN